MKRNQKIFLGIGAALTAAFIFLPKGVTVTEGWKSYLGQNNLPRGIRNNNPGNLIISYWNNWDGKIPESENTDGHFEQFTYFAYGVRAMMKDIIHDINSGLNTIDFLITEYAPPTDGNDTSGYINFVSSQTGIDKYATLNTDAATIQALAKAISKKENGGNYITANDLQTAWSLI